jgi:hypothetical protein
MLQIVSNVNHSRRNQNRNLKGFLVLRVPRNLVISLALAALSAFLVAAPAQGQTVADCQGSIEQLRGATLSATFTGRNGAKDQTGLTGKLDTAAEKLEQGKTDDALQALTQFQAKVVALNAQGKIADDGAASLITGVTEAIACVQALAVES